MDVGSWVDRGLGGCMDDAKKALRRRDISVVVTKERALNIGVNGEWLRLNEF